MCIYINTNTNININININTAQGPQWSADISSHTGPVWRVKWAHPRFGVLLASCGYDKKVNNSLYIYLYIYIYIIIYTNII